jgi:hypothetical protein
VERMSGGAGANQSPSGLSETNWSLMGSELSEGWGGSTVAELFSCPSVPLPCDGRGDCWQPDSC